MQNFTPQSPWQNNEWSDSPWRQETAPFSEPAPELTRQQRERQERELWNDFQPYLPQQHSKQDPTPSRSRSGHFTRKRTIEYHASEQTPAHFNRINRNRPRNRPAPELTRQQRERQERELWNDFQPYLPQQHSKQDPTPSRSRSGHFTRKRTIEYHASEQTPAHFNRINRNRPRNRPAPELTRQQRERQERELWNDFQPYLPQQHSKQDPTPSRSRSGHFTRKRTIEYHASEQTPAHFNRINRNRPRNRTTTDTSVGAMRAMEAQQAETDRGTWYPNVGKMLWNLPRTLVETTKFIGGVVRPPDLGGNIADLVTGKDEADWFTKEQRAIAQIGRDAIRSVFPRYEYLREVQQAREAGRPVDLSKEYPALVPMIQEYAKLDPISTDGTHALARHLEEEPDVLLNIALSATGIGLATAGVRHGVKAGRRIARAADRTLSPFSADVLDPVRAAHVDIEVLGKRQWTLDRNFGHRETLSTGMGTHLGEGRVSTALHVITGHGADDPLNLSGARVMITDRQGRRIRAHGVQGTNIESDLALLHAENLRTPSLNLETFRTPDRTTQRITSPYSTTGAELGLSQRRGQAGESGAGYITETGEFGVYLGEFEDSAQGIFATRQNLLNLQRQEHPFIAFSDFDTARAATQLERYGLHYQHARGTAQVQRPRLHSGQQYYRISKRTENPLDPNIHTMSTNTTNRLIENFVVAQQGGPLSTFQRLEIGLMGSIKNYVDFGDPELHKFIQNNLPPEAEWRPYGLQNQIYRKGLFVAPSIQSLNEFFGDLQTLNPRDLKGTIWEGIQDPVLRVLTGRESPHTYDLLPEERIIYPTNIIEEYSLPLSGKLNLHGGLPQFYDADTPRAHYTENLAIPGNRTFGVEIEFLTRNPKASRRNLYQAFKEFEGLKFVYDTSIRHPDTTLEIIHQPPGMNPAARTADAARVRSGSAIYAHEMVSPVYQGETGLRDFSRVVNRLQDFEPEFNTSVAMHIHTGMAEGIGALHPKERLNIYGAYAAYEPAIDLLHEPSRRGKSLHGYAKNLDLENFLKLRAELKSTDTHQWDWDYIDPRLASEDRYKKLNIYGNTGKTLEYRQPAATADINEIASHIRFYTNFVEKFRRRPLTELGRGLEYGTLNLTYRDAFEDLGITYRGDRDLHPPVNILPSEAIEGTGRYKWTPSPPPPDPSAYNINQAPPSIREIQSTFNNEWGIQQIDDPRYFNLHSGRNSRDPFQLSNRLVAHQTTEQNYRNILQRGAILSPHQTGQQLGMGQIDRYAGDAENVFLGKLPSAAGYGDYGLIFPTEPLIERYNARISQYDLIPDYEGLEDILTQRFATPEQLRTRQMTGRNELWQVPDFRHRFRDATRRLQASERLTGRPALNLYDTEPFIEMTVPNQVPIAEAVGVVQANRKFLITPETRGADFQRWQLDQFPNRPNLHSKRRKQPYYRISKRAENPLDPNIHTMSTNTTNRLIENFVVAQQGGPLSTFQRLEIGLMGGIKNYVDFGDPELHKFIQNNLPPEAEWRPYGLQNQIYRKGLFVAPSIQSLNEFFGDLQTLNPRDLKGTIWEGIQDPVLRVLTGRESPHTYDLLPEERLIYPTSIIEEHTLPLSTPLNLHSEQQQRPYTLQNLIDTADTQGFYYRSVNPEENTLHQFTLDASQTARLRDIVDNYRHFNSTVAQDATNWEIYLQFQKNLENQLHPYSYIQAAMDWNLDRTKKTDIAVYREGVFTNQDFNFQRAYFGDRGWGEGGDELRILSGEELLSWRDPHSGLARGEFLLNPQRIEGRLNIRDISHRGTNAPLSHRTEIWETDPDQLILRRNPLNLHSRKKQRYGTQTLYHATRPENVQSILEHGLDPTRSRGKRQEVYLFTPSREQWAREHIQQKYGVPPDEVPIFQATVDRSQLTRRWRGIWSTPEHITPDKIVRLHSGQQERIGMEHITRNKDTYSQIIDSGELKLGAYNPYLWFSMGPHYQGPRQTDTYGFIFPASTIQRYEAQPYDAFGGFPEWETYKEKHLSKAFWEYERAEQENILKRFMQTKPDMLERSHTFQFDRKGYSEFVIDKPIPIHEASAVVEQNQVKIITPDTRGMNYTHWKFREPTDEDWIPLTTDPLHPFNYHEKKGLRLHSRRPSDWNYVPDYDIDYDVDIPIGMPKVPEIERPPTVTPPAPPQRLTGQQQLEALRARSVGTTTPEFIPRWKYTHALRQAQIQAYGQDLSRLGTDFDFSETPRRRRKLSPAQRLERWWIEKSMDTGVGAIASQNIADATQSAAIIGVAAEAAWEGTQAILGNDVNLGGFVRAGVEAGIGYGVNRWNRRYTQMPKEVSPLEPNIGQAPPDARQNLERLFREAGAGTYRWRRGALDDLLHTYSDAELNIMLGSGGAEYLRDHAENIRQFGQHSHSGQRDWGQTVQGLLTGDFGGSTRYVYSPETRTVTPTQSTQWSVDEVLERYGDRNILLSTWKERRREIRAGERTDWLSKIGLPLQEADTQPNAFSMILPEKRIIGQLFNRYKAEPQLDDLPVQHWTAKDWLLRNWGLQDFAEGIGAQKWAENIGRRKEFRADRDAALEARKLNPELYEWQDPDHFFITVAERFGIDASDFQGFGAERLGSPYHRWGRFGAKIPRQAKYPLIGAAAAAAGYIGYQTFFGGDDQTLHLNRPENYAMSIRYPLLGATLRTKPIRRLRARGENLLNSVYGEGTFHSEMMKSIVLGEKRNLPEEVTEIYEQTGQVHALVQSGMHVNMFGGLLRRYPLLSVPAAISTVKDTIQPPNEVVEEAQTGAWDRYNIFQLNPNPRMERWNPKLPSSGEIRFLKSTGELPQDYELSFEKPWWGWWDPKVNYEASEDRRRQRRGAAVIPGGGYGYEVTLPWTEQRYFGISAHDPTTRTGRLQKHLSGKGSKAIREKLTISGGEYTSQDFTTDVKHFPNITYYQLGEWERKQIAHFDTQQTGFNRSAGGEIRDPNYRWTPHKTQAKPFVESQARLRDILPWATYTMMGVLPEAAYTYSTAERTRREMDAYLFPKDVPPMTPIPDTSVGAFRTWEAHQQEQDKEMPEPETELIWSRQEQDTEAISEQEKLLLLLSETTGNEQLIAEITSRVLEELEIRQRSRYTDP